MIAHRPVTQRGRGSNIPNAVIDTALTRHPDGFGIAWRDSDGLRYEKFGPTKVEKAEFRRLLKEIDKRRDIEYVAHWRMATHGPACEDLAHPYEYTDPVEGRVLVFHNGVIDIFADKHESDTQVFVRDILANLPSAWWRQPAIVDLVDMSTGWSKLVLMTETETVNLNERHGTKDGGLWYSSNHLPGWSTNSVAKYASYLDDEWDNDWERIPGGAWVRKTEPRSIIPYSAAESAKTFGLGETTQPMSNTALWQHEGHIIEPLQSFDFTKDGDYPSSIICTECGTSGDVYLIQGRAFTDINHVWHTVNEAHDVDEAADSDELLPV